MKRPRAGSHDPMEGGEGYLVSASDLLAGLLFLFIIMVTSFAIDLANAQVKAELQRQQSLAQARRAREAEKRAVEAEAKARELQATLQEERRRVEELQKKATRENERLRAAEDLRSEFIARLRDQLKDSGLDVSVDLEHGLMRLPEEILFRSGTDEFVQEGEQSLEVLAHSLARLLPRYAGKTDEGETDAAKLEAISIEGHTDSRPKRDDGRIRDNWELSAARAIRTYNTLVKLEPELAALKNVTGEPLFGVAGYADSRLIDRGTSAESQARNRRIDLRFLVAPPKGHPGTKESEAK